MAIRSKWLVLALLAACSKQEPDGTTQSGQALQTDEQRIEELSPKDERFITDNRKASWFKVGNQTIEELTKSSNSRLLERSAEELVTLKERRSEGYGLSADEVAVLDEYDDVLARIMSCADAESPGTNETRPCIVTRDYELWILPGKDPHRYTVKDRVGAVLAERVDEDRLRRDFSYLQNLLHPEYLQFYDTVDNVDY